MTPLSTPGSVMRNDLNDRREKQGDPNNRRERKGYQTLNKKQYKEIPLIDKEALKIVLKYLFGDPPTQWLCQATWWLCALLCRKGGGGTPAKHGALKFVFQWCFKVDQHTQ